MRPAIVIGLLTVWAHCAADVSIYRGQKPDGKTLIASSWGAGEVSVSNDVVLNGAQSLKITSKGAYQGAALSFDPTIDVSSVASDPTNLLVISIYPSDAADSGSGSTSNQRQMRLLRVVLVTDDNKRTELRIPMNRRSDQTWISVGAPFNAYPGFEESSKKIKRIALFSDISTTFYLGEIRVVNDRTPISVDAYINESAKETYFPNNDTALFWAVVDGGASSLKISWDFDDRDGIQDEVEGLVVEHMFRRPGDYVVTCTVTDRYGVKKPASATVTIHVTP